MRSLSLTDEGSETQADALWELVRQPDGESGRRFLEEAVATEAGARQLRVRWQQASVAAVGLDEGKRAATAAIFRRRLAEPGLSPRHRTEVALAALHLVGPVHDVRRDALAAALAGWQAEDDADRRREWLRTLSEDALSADEIDTLYEAAVRRHPADDEEIDPFPTYRPTHMDNRSVARDVGWPAERIVRVTLRLATLQPAEFRRQELLEIAVSAAGDLAGPARREAVEEIARRLAPFGRGDAAARDLAWATDALARLGDRVPEVETWAAAGPVAVTAARKLTKLSAAEWTDAERLAAGLAALVARRPAAEAADIVRPAAGTLAAAVAVGGQRTVAGLMALARLLPEAEAVPLLTKAADRLTAEFARGPAGWPRHEVRRELAAFRSPLPPAALRKVLRAIVADVERGPDAVGYAPTEPHTNDLVRFLEALPAAEACRAVIDEAAGAKRLKTQAALASGMGESLARAGWPAGQADRIAAVARLLIDRIGAAPRSDLGEWLPGGFRMLADHLPADAAADIASPAVGPVRRAVTAALAEGQARRGAKNVVRGGRRGGHARGGPRLGRRLRGGPPGRGVSRPHERLGRRRDSRRTAAATAGRGGGRGFADDALGRPRHRTVWRPGRRLELPSVPAPGGRRSPAAGRTARPGGGRGGRPGRAARPPRRSLQPLDSRPVLGDVRTGPPAGSSSRDRPGGRRRPAPLAGHGRGQSGAALADLAAGAPPAEAAEVARSALGWLAQTMPRSARKVRAIEEVWLSGLLRFLPADEARRAAGRFAVMIASDARQRFEPEHRAGPEFIDTRWKYFAALLTDESPDDIRRRAPAVAASLAAGSPFGVVPAAAVAAEPFGCRLTTPQLVELLKMPTLRSEARRVVLDHLGTRYGRVFRDPWAFVRFAKEAGLDLDFATPPTRAADWPAFDE